ncbi:arginyltransferase [Frigoriglobus tundricola]|uniref:Aspartate/glutamate leucyltransferase n=1 Tax=Frigoriglobus tundricola TaxID=2774151 RepID=A0A6M5YJM4_9BACT|nr:arginyltransferase [Frigoriglobus tundricola]QJW93463.1 Arginyl-tRNA--protein transferase [Frigoriglobus tundricola]
MHSLFVFNTPPSPCSYLPHETASLNYEIVGQLTAPEYQTRLLVGWRRFGYALFRPTCPACTKCESVRVPVATFRPDRSQRRCLAANADEVRLVIGEPDVTAEKLELYDRFHAFQAEHVGWPSHGPKDAAGYAESFVDNPFDTQEWCYYLGDRLVGVGYVDRLPAGLSAIYFFHDPDERQRSLGTYNVLSVLRGAAAWELPHVYLGYYVAGCRSLEYKTRFRPIEVLGAGGAWRIME